MGRGGEFSGGMGGEGGRSYVVFPEVPGYFFWRKTACDSVTTGLIYSNLM